MGGDPVTRIVLPYVQGMLHQDTLDLAQRSGYLTQHARLPATDTGAYARLMIRLWRTQETVIILEQDTTVPRAWLDHMIWCPSPWCTVPHDATGVPSLDLLGCTKLHETMMRQHPRLADGWLAVGWPHPQPVDYRRVALRLSAGMRLAGYEPCGHGTHTEHHQPVTQEGRT